MENSRPLPHAYERPALAFLLVTLLAGVWLRTALLFPAARLELPFRFMVHAHSHVAFYGWVTLMLFGAVLRSTSLQATSFFRGHARLATLTSAAAFIAFLLGGYGPAAIALSVLTVALWIAFALRVRTAVVDAPAWRAALLFLVISGLATLAPMIVLLRGATSAWAAEFAIKIFLAPFINGWVTLGVIAAIASATGLADGRAARWLIAAGAVPSTLLFVAAPAPHPALPLLGRAGVALVGLGSLAFALAAWRNAPGLNGWLRIGLAALALKALLELLAAAGVAPGLMRHPQVIVAHLHLVLLGFVTASLVGTALRYTRADTPLSRLSALLFATGAGAMIAAIVTGAWAALYLFVARAGLDLTDLLRIALAGGVLAASATALALRALQLAHRPSPGRPEPSIR